MLLTQEGKKENNLKIREWRQTPCCRDLVSVKPGRYEQQGAHLSERAQETCFRETHTQR